MLAVPLTEFVADQIWTRDYPVRYAGCRFDARMSVVRLGETALMLHSPCAIDTATRDAIAQRGSVTHIVAPGSFHYLHIASAQRAFPDAETVICPGIERKRPGLDFDAFLGPRPPAAWRGVIDTVLIRGCRFMWEVAMLHRPSRTLLLVDAIENFTDRTENVSWALRAWFKGVFRMWNRPRPAPEYRLGWLDKTAARRSFEQILAWDFEQIIVSHGDNIHHHARQVARSAWRPLLRP